MNKERRQRRQLGRREFLRASALGAGSALATVAGSAAPTDAHAQGAGTGAMPRRPLGRTGAMLPILMLGTAQRMDPRYDKVMHRCFREGVDAIDTALSYGWGASHGAIATFMEQIGGRDKVWLTSKSGAGSPERFVRDSDEALAQLHTDRLDLFLLHGINSTRDLERAHVQAGETLRRSGRTRFFGFSCHGGNLVELMHRAVELGGVDAILLRYNFRRYGDKALNRALDACHKAGIGLIAMKTMGGVSADDEAVAGFRSRNFTLAQAKLKAVWADERIASVCSEMDSVQVVGENVAAAKAGTALSAGEMHQLNRLAALTAPLACLGCSHLCEGALGNAVPIAEPLRALMYHEAYGAASRARELYRTLPPAAWEAQGMDFGPAVAACPQGIDIPARLRRARELLAV